MARPFPSPVQVGKPDKSGPVPTCTKGQVSLPYRSPMTKVTRVAHRPKTKGRIVESATCIVAGFSGTAFICGRSWDFEFSNDGELRHLSLASGNRLFPVPSKRGRFGGMVRGTGRLCRLAQSDRISSRKHVSSFSGCRSSHSFGLVVAKTGFHNACSTFGPQVRIFPDVGGGESQILGSDLSL